MNNQMLMSDANLLGCMLVCEFLISVMAFSVTKLIISKLKQFYTYNFSQKLSRVRYYFILMISALLVNLLLLLY